MKLSTRSRYGVRLMLEMASAYEKGPVRLGDVAQRQGIPLKYLEQIIIPLKKAQYIQSIRGPRGGHLLTKDPGTVTVGEIVSLLEDGFKLTRCTNNPEECPRSADCVTRFLWKEVTEAMHQRLDAISFSQLLQEMRSGKLQSGCAGKSNGGTAEDYPMGVPARTKGAEAREDGNDTD